MADYNLEPIEEKDTDLESKFKAGQENVSQEKASKESKPEAPIMPEVKKVETQQEVSRAEKENAYQKIIQKTVKQDDDTDEEEVKSDAGNVIKIEDAQQRVEQLVGLASSKGVFHAVKVARHMEDNFILDELHDRLLADELHDALIKKGLLKEV